MRAPVVVVAALFAAYARADWLFDIPTGRKIPLSTVRLDLRAGTRSNGFVEARLGLGVTQSIETTIRTLTLGDGDPTSTTFDVAYTALAPVPSISPGVSLGVLDAARRTGDGRRAFVAFTFREDFDSVDGTLPADVTIGAFAGDRSCGFAGIRVPLAKNLHAYVEHGGVRIATGFEWRFLPRATTRLGFREGVLTLGLSLTRSF